MSARPLKRGMNRIDRIIAKFGGLSALSAALGHKHPTTVQGWQGRGNIPKWREAEVAAAAARLRIDLGRDWFADPPDEPRRKAGS